jgi:hypothetical protein
MRFLSKLARYEGISVCAKGSVVDNRLVELPHLRAWMSALASVAEIKGRTVKSALSWRDKRHSARKLAPEPRHR